MGTGPHEPGADAGPGPARHFAGAVHAASRGEGDVSPPRAGVNWVPAVGIVAVFYSVGFVSQLREIYRLTEGLQRERASLLKQLDLLRCGL